MASGRRGQSANACRKAKSASGSVSQVEVREHFLKIGGPILKSDDMPYRGIKVPDEFWKVIAYVENGTLKARAYVLSQADYLDDIEALELDEFRLWQITLADLGSRIQLDFGALAAADALEPERLRRPEMVSASGRLVREILRREDLFIR